MKIQGVPESTYLQYPLYYNLPKVPLYYVFPNSHQIPPHLIRCISPYFVQFFQKYGFCFLKISNIWGPHQDMYLVFYIVVEIGKLDIHMGLIGINHSCHMYAVTLLTREECIFVLTTQSYVLQLLLPAA